MNRVRRLNARSIYSLAALAVLLAFVGGVVAGCGGSSSSKPSGNGPSTGSTITKSNTSGSTTGSTTTKSGWG